MAKSNIAADVVMICHATLNRWQAHYRITSDMIARTAEETLALDPTYRDHIDRETLIEALTEIWSPSLPTSNAHIDALRLARVQAICLLDGHELLLRQIASLDALLPVVTDAEALAALCA